jgi:type II secretory pathway pseudopilin PulG
MSKLTIVLLIIVIVLIAALVALYFFGRKAQRKQIAQKEQMDAIAQTVSMLVIDKKRLRISESGLPEQVIGQTPKLLRWNKLPIVKAKVGPKVMTLACDERVFELIPVKREVKVVVSGIYITDIKSARGGLETPVKKKGFFKRLFNK